jgi:hypothetical protein
MVRSRPRFAINERRGGSSNSRRALSVKVCCLTILSIFPGQIALVFRRRSALHPEDVPVRW